MKASKTIGRLVTTMAILVAGLVVSAGPASAASGTAHYENVGNPGWCLDGNGVRAYLHRCGGVYQTWQFSDGSRQFTMKQIQTGTCLTSAGYLGATVSLATCNGGLAQLWNAWGTNGWVVFQMAVNPGECIRPTGTEIPGRNDYDLILSTCPEDVSNVPNIYAWRYH